ncbi:protoporphyrinogen oxidase [Halorhabdus sp. CBA1104]|uniref:protoporphyrinogen oxidase n=1 Tax=Halorhabdus sp. CBA1104 TaxID=1380432 RepID=UPI0012B25BF7|nr:protoporphyrinogen oxidase [Halorhabdus sp. CBA1104]QGN07970.1 protoporphyrinogen oxidase [Halorhabdus sp. CBA1104]
MTVAVVGAGMSGLALTHFLAERGADVHTFEAAAEPGGVVRSKTVDGHVLETGPQRLRLSEPVQSLVETLDLEDELRYGHDDQPLFAYHDGQLRTMPLSVREAITTDLLSWPGKARVLLEPLTRGPQPEETVDGFLTRKFGAEAARRFMGPLYSGLYGSDPDEMYVEYSLGRALDHVGIERSILLYAARKLLEGVDPPSIVTFEAGLQRLPDAISEAHADTIELNTPVTSVERAGDGYLVHTEDETHAVETVAFTTPAPTTAALLDGVDPAAADVLKQFTYNPIGVVHLRSDFDGTGHGFHIIDDGFLTDGSTWNHSMLDRDGVFTSYVGSGDADALDADPAVIGRRAAEEFETVTGEPADVLDVSILRPGMPAYDRSWAALEDLSLPDGIEIAASYTSRAGIVGRIADGRQTAASIVEE